MVFNDKRVALVKRMLELHRKLAAASIPDDKKLYQRQITATDHQVNALVYKLVDGGGDWGGGGSRCVTGGCAWQHDK